MTHTSRTIALVSIFGISTVVLMVMAGGFALLLESALQAFNILLQIGAGTGLLFILRWFWWRINAFSELTAMVVSFGVAVYFQLFGSDEVSDAVKLVTGVGITTASWILVTLITQPASKETLRSFYCLVRPGGPGWKKVLDEAREDGTPLDEDGRPWSVPFGILCMVAGCFAVYSTLFATGYWIYGRHVPAVILSVVAVVSTIFLMQAWKRVNAS